MRRRQARQRVSDNNGQPSYWWVPIVTTLIVAVAGIATALITKDSDGSKAPSMSLSTPPTTHAQTSRPPVGNAVVLDFDGGIVSDAQGNRIATSVTAPERPGVVRGPNPEMITTIPRVGGRAIQFPPRCPGTATPACPSAVIDVAHADDLNPLDADFSYGVWLAVTPEQIVPSANVVQKGLSAGTANANQWKIELVSGDRPSCVVIGKDGEPRRATSEFGIADGSWHKVACVRTGSVLTLQVDSVTRRTVTIPEGLTVNNPEPLRLGGNAPNQVEHRFAGALDDVTFARH